METEKGIRVKDLSLNHLVAGFIQQREVQVKKVEIGEPKKEEPNVEVSDFVKMPLPLF